MILLSTPVNIWSKFLFQKIAPIYFPEISCFFSISFFLISIKTKLTFELLIVPVINLSLSILQSIPQLKFPVSKLLKHYISLSNFLKSKILTVLSFSLVIKVCDSLIKLHPNIFPNFFLLFYKTGFLKWFYLSKHLIDPSFPKPIIRF